MVTDNLNFNSNPNSNLEIPVIFYDGAREIDLGQVQVTPTITTFKLLQSTLSNKIGISPNHITIYLDRNDLHFHLFYHHRRRRHPVTSKFDFTVLQNGGCFFWVVLKRSRRNRRRRNKNDAVLSGCSLPFGLIRRGFDNSDLEYGNRLRMIDEFEREKERYIMSLNLNSNVYNEMSRHGYNHLNHNRNEYNYYGWDELESCSSSTGGASSERVFCDVCYNHSSAETVPFHCCKKDVVVTTGFRSVVGPIAPPSKNSLPG